MELAFCDNPDTAGGGDQKCRIGSWPAIKFQIRTKQVLKKMQTNLHEEQTLALVGAVLLAIPVP